MKTWRRDKSVQRLWFEKRESEAVLKIASRVIVLFSVCSSDLLIEMGQDKDLYPEKHDTMGSY
jgi:hypothetical protein